MAIRIEIDLSQQEAADRFSECEVGDTEEVSFEVVSNDGKKLVGELTEECDGEVQEGEEAVSESESSKGGDMHKGMPGIMIVLGKSKGEK